MKLLRQDKNGQTYQADGFRVYYRKAGHTAGDNNVNSAENMYLISGEAAVVIDNKEHPLSAPDSIYIPEKTHHSIIAITDVAFIIQHP